MAVYIEDIGDSKDPVKWDFDERFLKVIYTNDDYYPYKTNSKKNANILSNFRRKIRILCHNIENNFYEVKKFAKGNQEYIEGVRVFLDIHQDYFYNLNTKINLPEPFFSLALNGLPVSKYLLSEIPKKTGFSGLNKPKMRHENINLGPVGKDGKGRALYRDIFLDLDMSDKKLDELVIHELAHTGANHISFVKDNHYADFKWFEQLIIKFWPS